MVSEWKKNQGENKANKEDKAWEDKENTKPLVAHSELE